MPSLVGSEMCIRDSLNNLPSPAGQTFRHRWGLSETSEAPGSTSSSRFTLKSTSNHNPQQSTYTCRTNSQAQVGSINHFSTSEAPGSTSSSRFTLRSTSNHNPQQSTFTCRTNFQARVGSINHFTLDFGGKHQNVFLDRIKAAHVDPSSLVQVAVPGPPLTRI